MKVAVLTTIFPQVEGFAKEFEASLKSQTYQKFDLLICWDGVVPYRLLEELPCKQINLVMSEGIVLNRKNLIKNAYELGYDVAIFCDSDDIHEKSRFELIMDHLTNNDVVVNDLAIFSNDIKHTNRMIGSRVDGGITYKHIIDSNFMGLTNTAAKLPLLYSASRSITPDVLAFDWAMYTRILLSGAKCEYCPAGLTYYRQYTGNDAPRLILTAEEVLKAVNVKCIHYQFLSTEYSEFRERNRQFLYLKSTIRNDKNKLSLYTEYVNKMQGTFWWEKIQPLFLE